MYRQISRFIPTADMFLNMIQFTRFERNYSCTHHQTFKENLELSLCVGDVIH